MGTAIPGSPHPFQKSTIIFMNAMIISAYYGRSVQKIGMESIYYSVKGKFLSSHFFQRLGRRPRSRPGPQQARTLNYIAFQPFPTCTC
jgi:hypothetical protein